MIDHFEYVVNNLRIALQTFVCSFNGTANDRKITDFID